MSLGNWLHCLAIGGILVASLAGEGQAQSNSYPVEHGRQSPPNATPSYTEPNCPKATSAEEANFCVQRRAAEAAEQQAISASEQADWSRAQFWLGVIGLAALVATLIFTAKAAAAAKSAAESGLGMLKHAADAAKAAQDSVEEARKATKFAQVTADAAREALAITDRAWIKIEVELTEPLVFEPDTITIAARFTFRNVGKAPATHVLTTHSFHAVEADAATRVQDLTDRVPLAWSAGRHMGIGRTIFPDETHIEEWLMDMATADFKAGIVRANQWGAESAEPYTVTSEHPCILAGVSYGLPGDRSHRCTYVPFQIRSTAERHAGWNGDACVVPRDELVLRIAFMGGFVK